MLLEQTLGFGHKKQSTEKKLGQAYDNRTNKHVIWLEYRVRVSSDTTPMSDPAASQAADVPHVSTVRAHSLLTMGEVGQ